MSKSLGNVVNPIDLMDRYGCDALRFTLALQAIPGRDLRLVEKRIEGNRNFITKLWNSARFLELQDCRYDRDFAIGAIEGSLHKWMLVRLRETTIKVERALDDQTCLFHEASSVLYHFLWDVFCDQYLEMVKLVLSNGNAAEKEEARFSSAWIFYGLLRLLHPFVPFVTEKIFCDAEIFASRGKDERLITSQWLSAESLAFTADNCAGEVAELEWVLGLVGEVRSLRSCLGLSPREIVPLRCEDLTSTAESYITSWTIVARGMAGVEWSGRGSRGDGIKEEKIVGFIYDGFINAGLGLPSGFAIAEAKSRVAKQLELWESEYEALDKKLSPDAGFAKNAPEAIKRAEQLKFRKAERYKELLAKIHQDL